MDVAAGLYNMKVEQGATFTLLITYTDSDGVAVDLSSYSGRGQIREVAGQGAAVADFTVTVHDPLNGGVTVSLTAEQTEAIPTTGKTYSELEIYTYDIELYSDTEVVRILNGRCAVSPGVTR